MSSGKWRDSGVPHKGWTYLGCEDSGSLSMTCEMCEKEEIRHIHTVSHPGLSDDPGGRLRLRRASDRRLCRAARGGGRG